MDKKLTDEEYRQIMYDRWEDEISNGICLTDLTEDNKELEKIIKEVKANLKQN